MAFSFHCNLELRNHRTLYLHPLFVAVTIKTTTLKIVATLSGMEKYPSSKCGVHETEPRRMGGQAMEPNTGRKSVFSSSRTLDPRHGAAVIFMSTYAYPYVASLVHLFDMRLCTTKPRFSFGHGHLPGFAVNSIPKSGKQYARPSRTNTPTSTLHLDAVNYLFSPCEVSSQGVVVRIPVCGLHSLI